MYLIKSPIIVWYKESVSTSSNLRYEINLPHLMPFMWPNLLQNSLFVLALIQIPEKNWFNWFSGLS